MLWPLSFVYPEDGYPFSSYPMFAHGRETTRIRVEHVVAVGRDQARVPVSPAEIGTHLVMQSLMTISNAVSRGDANTLCKRVAERVAARRSRYGDPVKLEVVTSEYDVTRYFAVSRVPLTRELHAECPVPGGP